MGCELIGSFGMGGLCAGFWKANLKRSRSRFVGPKKEFRTHRDFQTEAVFLFLGVLFFLEPFLVGFKGGPAGRPRIPLLGMPLPSFRIQGYDSWCSQGLWTGKGDPLEDTALQPFQGLAWIGLDWWSLHWFEPGWFPFQLLSWFGLDWFGGEMKGKALFTLYKNHNFKSPNQSKPQRSFRGLDWLVAWDAYACLSTINLRFQQARTTPLVESMF